MAENSSSPAAGVESSNSPVDLSNCDREPIHIPGSIQPYGVLLTLQEPALHITQCSANVREFFGVDAGELLGQSIEVLLDTPALDAVRTAVHKAHLNDQPSHVITTRLGDSGEFHLLLHRRKGVLIAELEPLLSGSEVSLHNLYSLSLASLSRLESAQNMGELCRIAAEEVRRVTSFDKVMVYQFDADWNGTVVAEESSGKFESYLDLRFPASDIPRQARQLYLLNRLRLIPDASYTPSPVQPALNPQTQQPLDLSFAFLRSVSPVHIEYLKNMGVTASMSISIIRDGQLWGLIACHHATPKYLSYEIRSICELIGQVLALQIGAKEGREDYEARLHLRGLHVHFLAAMARHAKFVEGLRECEAELLEFVGAGGAAICLNDEYTLLGNTPAEKEVRLLAAWLRRNPQMREQKYFHSSELAREYPQARAFQESAGGVLAVALSEIHNSYMMWFRPEVVQTVKWSGDPNKPVEPGPNGWQIHPRKSFSMWQETLRGRSLEWKSYEIAAANELRQAIINIVLRRAEEMADLNEELTRTNQELEAFSYSVSHDLRAPFRHISGYAELLQTRVGGQLDETGARYLATVIQSAQYAGTLVDNLLAFSQMGRTEMSRMAVNMNSLLREVLSGVREEGAGREIHWSITDLPSAQGDPEMLRLVWRNLLSNAVKYTQQREIAEIEVGCTPGENENVFWVRDNGVGFDMQYVGKLFGVFQRLHGVEEFQGTGIGLANVRRIVMRHGGRTWAEGDVNHGATFYFSLPTLGAMQRFNAPREDDADGETIVSV
jgi:light-regulated signal transduction histidine kinase (bacteriophytochrome)